MHHWGQEGVELPVPATKLVSAEASTPKLTVETVDNHVYFYATVNSDRCLALVRTIRELDGKLRNEHASRALPAEHPLTPIWLHVNSDGGSVFDALGVADQLKSIKTPIFSVVEGCAASSATLLSVPCTKRFITSSSFMLIHQVSSIMWGTYEQFKDQMKVLDMIMRQLVNFYSTHTKLEPLKLEELLKRDSWFAAQQCVDIGLVDAIL